MAPRKRAPLNLQNNARIVMKSGYISHEVFLFETLRLGDIEVFGFGDVSQIVEYLTDKLSCPISLPYIRLYRTESDTFKLLCINIFEIASVEEI